MTAAQKAAIENHWPRFGIEFEPKRLDLDRIFGRRAPRVLDIGSGMGQTTAALAAVNPGFDYLAVEVHRPGVGSLIRLAQGRSAHNIRIICHDVIDVLRFQLPPQSVDLVLILFPDPWPKKRHHKRRLITGDFLSVLVPALRSHARIWLSTDSKDMAAHMLGTCDADPRLVNLAGPGNFAPRPRWRPETRFERRGLRLAHEVRDLAYVLRPGNNALNETTASNSPVSRSGA